MNVRMKVVSLAILPLLAVSLLSGCASWGAGRTEDRAAPAPAKAMGNSFELTTEAVRLVKSAPAIADLGATFESVIQVTALTRAAGVLVTDTIPAGASYVKSDPEATVSGNQLSWRLDNLSKGEVRNLRVWVKADKEGQLTSCSTVTAIPQGCLATVVGKPVLAIEKTGPARARVGNDVVYTVVVRNTGSALAKNVVVTDTLPDGLDHASGKSALMMDLGDLEPGAAKSMQVTAKATKTGKFCNVAVAKSANAGEVKDDACTVVVQPMLKVAKTGTKEQFIGKTAAYEIVVANPGDERLTNVTITDTAPAATRIVAAPGANVSGNQATWKLAELKGGAEESFKLTLTSATAGTHCNRVNVGSTEGLTAASEACTLWKGQAAILIEVVDNPDPILVGESTTYSIRVTNQGTADDTNIKIVASFGKEIDPVSAAGQTAGTVAGKTVTFAPAATLGPKQAIQWTISAKGASAGDHRLKVALTSTLLGNAVTEEESTHVY